MEKAAKEKPTFFAFGAGHLGNEKGSSIYCVREDIP